MFLTFIEFAMIIAIDIMGLNFFNNKFLIKSTFFKVTGCYIYRNRFAYVNIFANFIDVYFFIDKLSMQKINALKLKR
jgi:hypothetical protein